MQFPKVRRQIEDERVKGSLDLGGLVTTEEIAEGFPTQ